MRIGHAHRSCAAASELPADRPRQAVGDGVGEELIGAALRGEVAEVDAPAAPFERQAPITVEIANAGSVVGLGRPALVVVAGGGRRIESATEEPLAQQPLPGGIPEEGGTAVDLVVEVRGEAG